MKTHDSHPKLSREGGLITMIFLVLMSIMVILVVANTRALFHLHRETQLLERQQIQRLAGSVTNGVLPVTLNAGTLTAKP